MAVLVSPWRAAGAAECPARAGEALTELGQLSAPQISLNGFSRLQRLSSPYPELKPRYYMLRIAARSAPPGDWLLTIRDGDYRQLATLGAADFAKSNGGLWTGRLEASSILLHLHIGAGDPDVKLVVEKALFMPEKVANPRYSWQGDKPTYTSLYDSAGTRDEIGKDRPLGDRVGFMIGMGPASTGEDANWCCSGVMLTGSLFLTNWHCGAAPRLPPGAFWHADRCAATLIDTSWDEDRVSREFSCSKVEASSEDFDYAILRVTPIAGSDAFRAPPLLIASSPVRTGTALRIVHHGECKRKLISRGCKVANGIYPGWRAAASTESRTDFAHDCDSEGGSSGAPVFDGRNALVGLHHLGFEAPAGECDKRNKAVHIGTILEHLKGTRPAVFEEISANAKFTPE